MIWYVDAEDLSCAWDTKEKAVNYLMGEAKRCELKTLDITEVFDDYIIYTFKSLITGDIFQDQIYTIFFNEKPYGQ